MPKSNEFSAVTIDLTNCDKEPIRIPGSIQPHGLLLVLQEPNLIIRQVSGNTNDFFDLQPQDILDKPLNFLVKQDDINTIKICLEQENFKSKNPLPIQVTIPGKSPQNFDGILHRSNKQVILELEPEEKFSNTSFSNFYDLVRNAVSQLQSSSDLEGLCQTVVKEIYQITKFDRVMLYRFNPDGNGTIVAEEKGANLVPYLGLQYPASDVPTQARELYLLNWLRLIPDSTYTPAPLIPEINPVTGTPTDLSFAVLRSVSPIHVKYLSNMGVTASMSISIVRGSKLWGLVACHHYSPKYVSYDIRKVCEFLGQVLSVELVAKENNEDYEYQIQLKDIQNKVLEYMSSDENFVNGLVHHQPNILDLVNATGALICFEGKYTTVGNTPSQADLEKLLEWLLENHAQTEIFVTNCLSKYYPEAEQFQEVASGLLAIPISKIPKNYMVWFRPEEKTTVKWAGNPNKPVEIAADGSNYLTPRASFEMWKEIIQGRSVRWKQCEIDAALTLKEAIVKIVLRQVDKLTQLNTALQLSEAQTRIKAQELQETLEELQQTQSQLIQSEKMSSLGQLVAGIAHEINNPINFIYGNISHATEYTKDLLNLVYLYEQHLALPSEAIAEKKEAIDFDFLVEDLPKLLSSMQVGANRIRDIVQSLRNFSRLDEAEKKSVDVHEGIDSTLLILQYRIKAKPERPAIEIIKEYGDLPKIECYPGQLNQVLMNLLANAIDAVDEKFEIPEAKKNPEIHIQTAIIDDDWLRISVIDNGAGIHDDKKKHVFDPLFTTKPIGKGTGIGLAISYEIITQKHGGKLSCNSQLGEGTEFIIEIPQHQV